MPIHTFTTLNNSLAPNADTVVTGINASGTIVGYYQQSNGFIGFIDSGGTYTPITDPLDAAHTTQVLGINNAGQVVGDYVTGGSSPSFLLSGGSYTMIDDLLATNGTVASGINDRGQIVVNANNLHAYLLTPLATPVPEPCTLALCGLALLGLGLRVRMRQN